MHAVEYYQRRGANKSSIEHTIHTSRIEEHMNIILFKFNICPSIKSSIVNSTDTTDYNVSDYCTKYESFDIETKVFLFCPYSSCSYCNGIHFCSHVSGRVICIRCSQHAHLTTK